MTLLQVTSIHTDHELPLGKFFRTDEREHFTIKAIATDIQGEGEHTDKNGIVWSVAFDEEQSEHLTHVILTSVRPLKELILETEYS